MAGYFIEIQRDMRMRKSLLDTFSSAEFNTMHLNSNLYKVVLYIQDNKSGERICVLLKLLSLCLWVLSLSDSDKSGMDKVSTIIE